MKKEMEQGTWGFQGDVIIEAIDKLPDNVKLVRTPLAMGEVTGHAHRVNFDEVDVYTDEQGNLYTVPKQDGFIITHEEHNAVVVPLKRGQVGKVVIQREVDPFSEEIRQVRD